MTCKSLKGPKTGQEGPKKPLRGSKRVPRRPKSAPRRPKRPPIQPKRLPRRLQEGAHPGLTTPCRTLVPKLDKLSLGPQAGPSRALLEGAGRELRS